MNYRDCVLSGSADRGAIRISAAAGEECTFPIQSQFPFILPMSGQFIA